MKNITQKILKQMKILKQFIILQVINQNHLQIINIYGYMDILCDHLFKGPYQASLGLTKPYKAL